MDEKAKRPWLLILLALLIVAGGALYYTQRLTEWLAYDDEGGYLYAAWRISLGELPYRDFLTPQLPLFLYPGALVLSLSDLSVVAARWSMTFYVLGALLLTWLTVRRVWGAWPALLALILMAAQRDIFWAARFFRPEAPMLFWAALGLYLFALGYPEGRRGYLLAAGAALGLATMSKLFGALPMAGLGLFLLLQGFRARRWREVVISGLYVGLPFLLVIGLLTGLFQVSSGHFLAAALGHHLRQGSGTPWREVLLKAMRLYGDFVRAQPFYVALAGLGLILVETLGREPKLLAIPEPASRSNVSTIRRGPLVGLYVCQVPTVLAFLLITRDLQERHLTYIVPALAALGGVGLYGLWQLVAGRFVGTKGAWHLARPVVAWLGILALLALCLVPQGRYNAWVASWEEHTTDEWVRYIQAHTSPTDYVLCDYPGLNFFARRPAPPIAAGISRGAALSGQILGAQLIEEIGTYRVPMVLLNIAQGAHQFANLQDYDAFKRYVQTHFHLAERRQYDYRLIEIYAREDLWPGEAMRADLAHQIELTGLRWLDAEAAPGEQLQLELRWRGLAAMPTDYWVTLRLMDEANHEWGLGGKRLVDIDRETWWDERGLERAMLIPTTRWPLGEATIETFELPVSPGTPPGNYHVHLRVHPEGQWAGLSILDERGQPAGYDVPLGGATVLPATDVAAAGAPALATPLDTPLTADLTLLGYTLSAGDARPGDRLVVKLGWRATQAPAEDYALRLRLVGAGAEAVVPLGGAASSSRGFQTASYPSSAWRAGETLCGQYDLNVDRQAASGEYELELALLGKNGEPLATLPLTRLPVRARERVYASPLPEQPSDARFGDPPGMTLLGYDLRPELGGQLPLTLTWRADRMMDTSTTLFIHLLDEQGNIRGQIDTIPCAGDCPTTSWLPGEIIADTYVIPVSADAPPGRYTIALGWYDASTGVRLPGLDAGGQPLLMTACCSARRRFGVDSGDRVR